MKIYKSINKQEKEDHIQDLTRQFDRYMKKMNYFYGTNDFLSSFDQLCNKIALQDKYRADCLYLLSGGWFQIAAMLEFKELCFYDINPFQLLIYVIHLKILIHSDSLQNFIQNVTCQTLDNANITNNEQSIHQRNQPLNRIIMEQMREIMDEIQWTFYCKLVKSKQIYLSYFWKDDNDNDIQGKKLHSQKDYFTTLYYGQKEPFCTEQGYRKFREKVVKSKIKIMFKNIWDLQIQHDKNMIYIDGIDDKRCVYLNGNKREEIFKRIQKQLRDKDMNVCRIISTKSYITTIRTTKIICDPEAQIQETVQSRNIEEYYLSQDLLEYFEDSIEQVQELQNK